MNQLYLLRHGIALPHGTPDIPDDERPLTPKGEKRVHQVARGLRRLGIDLDRILTSPLPRAQKTAEIVANVFGLEAILEPVDALRADRDAASIRDWVGTRTENRIMLVGHNPSLSELAALLIGGPSGSMSIELRKGGIAAFSKNGLNAMHLDWLGRPRLFRRL
jgi:phosphohistidine phosphatase